MPVKKCSFLCRETGFLSPYDLATSPRSWAWLKVLTSTLS